MRYLLNFSFNGNYFYGYNKQKEKKTVQGEIEKLLSKRYNKIIKITGCSRTDRNVHSLDHYAHFDVDNKIDEEKLRVFLNKSLNGEIYIKSIIQLFTFHKLIIPFPNNIMKLLCPFKL